MKKLTTNIYLDLRLLSNFFLGSTTALIAPSVGAVWFDEVSTYSGIEYVGASFGASWGDMNTDGWPDLWTGNHGMHGNPRFYVNNGDGTFREDSQIVDFKTDDLHGAAWADFDNDGDQDLLVQVGAQSGNGVGPNQFFINNGGVLQEDAQVHGLSYTLGRGRTPMYFDWNNDGKLDVLLTNSARLDGQAPTALFSQVAGKFVDSFSQTGLNTNTNNNYNLFSQLLTIGRNTLPSILVHGSRSYPAAIYDPKALPFYDSSQLLGLYDDKAWAVYDVAIADFNGDLLSDVFLSRTSVASEAVLTESNVISAHLKLGHGGEQGFSFRGDGAIHIEINPRWVIKSSDIYIGKNGRKPQSTSFTVNSSDSDSQGMLMHVPGEDFGVFIGYDSDSGLWQVLVSKNSWLRTNILVTAKEPITDLQEVGFTNSDGSQEDRLLLQTESGFIDQSVLAGVNRSTSCESVTAADFDNDMDVDLYLVCTGSATNRTNILYENLGNGSFQEVPDAAGAGGSTAGRGESATSVDYDGDGYVDIFVTNGGGAAPFNNGPSQLFHNTKSGAHWLEIDLVGVVSNRDAIGTRVLLKAGGVTQVREQNGGIHRFSQNHQRIHFGLADSIMIDQITIFWPSGIVQHVHNIRADQKITIIEGLKPDILGRPEYSPGIDEGVFIYKDRVTGGYHLRVSGGGKFARYEVKLVSTDAIVAIPFNVESGDDWSVTEYGFSLTSRVYGWEDGVDFKVPENARVLFSVEKNGTPNPRQVHIGADRSSITPAGWILESEKLSTRPDFLQGMDDGLFIGQGTRKGVIEARCTSSGIGHRVGLELIGSNRVKPPIFLNIENDRTHVSNNSIALYGFIQGGWDGVDFILNRASDIGIAYTTDSLFQPAMVDFGTDNGFVPANAYWLP
ncbi:MAG: CRTAC1 family protein [Candidatus Thiodiazotropha sp. (ex Dulcina madagascariensis)]|nr:CRTAC1 family protein [Candidatus Thiodiazotropha sp. (ex Dulcina madagascariensis)]